MEDIELVIKIPEEIRIALLNNIQLSIDSCVKQAIINGTPLDDVIGKIEKLNPVDYGSMFSYESHNGARDMKRDILDILDSIGKESEE